MQNLDAFLSRLNPLVPGCPEPAARQALRDAAAAFCEATNVITCYSDMGSLRPGQAQYDLDLPADTDMVRALRVWVGGEPAQLTARVMMTASDPWEDARGQRRTGRPQWACSVERNTVTLMPTPDDRDAGLSLRALVATAPTMGATQLDDDLYFMWVDAVVMGAVARLAATPGVSFTSADMAGYATTRYLLEVSRARLERSSGRVVADVRVKGRTFSGARR